MVDKSEKFTWLVRLGYAARGVTYILLGWLALETSGQADGGNEAVFAMLDDVPLGNAILWLIALGLLGYAAFKFLSAIADIQNRGSDTKAAVQRIGDAASGIAYTVLAFAAFQFASGARQSAGSDSSQETTSSILSTELGWIVIGIVGLGFLVGAFMQAKSAITAQFLKRVSARAPQWTKIIGRLGHAARAVVFAVIGWSLVQSAWLESSDRAKGLGPALTSLRDNGSLYTLTAIGLIMFGIFSLIVSRYRIIPDLDASGVKPSFRT